MRVTNNLIVNTITGNLYKNAERLLKAQAIVATGKLINKPSDDPIGAGKILDYRKEISLIEQYKRNIVEGKTRIEVAETTLDVITDLLRDAKNIALDQSTSESESEHRDIAAEQVKEIRDQILSLANTKLEGNYIFAGHQTHKPAVLNDGTYDGDTGEIYITAGENNKVKVNATGDEIFISPGGVNVFDVLDDLQAALESNTYVRSDIHDQAAPLAEACDCVKNVRALSASRYSRLVDADERLTTFKFKFENMLSSIEDANMAQAIVELQRQEIAYKASLAASARVIQPSLIDFIR